jgi:hypothetical protein
VFEYVVKCQLDEAVIDAHHHVEVVVVAATEAEVGPLGGAVVVLTARALVDHGQTHPVVNPIVLAEIVLGHAAIKKPVTMY